MVQCNIQQLLFQRFEYGFSERGIIGKHCDSFKYKVSNYRPVDTWVSFILSSSCDSDVNFVRAKLNLIINFLDDGKVSLTRKCPPLFNK